MAETFLPLIGVVVVAVFARLVPWRSLPPRLALWGLTTVVVTVASTVVAALSVLAGGFILGTPAAQWVLQACSLVIAHHGVDSLTGIAAMGALSVIALRVSDVCMSVRAERITGTDPLTVVSTTQPIAFARPGRRAGVVVSTGMLDALTPDERRVLFAHERAHVRARHDLHFLALRFAGAVVPWLHRFETDCVLAAERAADAAALRELRGDRRLVATAIARAAIAADRHGAPSPSLAFVGGPVTIRVQSVLHPHRAAPGSLLVALAVGVGGAAAAGVFVHHVAILIAHVCA